MADTMTVADVRKMLKGLKPDEPASPTEGTEQASSEVATISDDGKTVDVDLDAIPDDVDKVDLPGGSTLERNKPKGKGKSK